jgi:hypothetical protein
MRIRVQLNVGGDEVMKAEAKTFESADEFRDFADNFSEETQYIRVRADDGAIVQFLYGDQAPIDILKAIPWPAQILTVRFRADDLHHYVMV